MNTGYITYSDEQPISGFDIYKEGIGIYISYKENINTVTKEMSVPDESGEGEITETKEEFEYTLYSSTVIINTYEELINELIKLKYTTQDELALLNNYLEDPDEDTEYKVYRSFVKECKSIAKEKYFELGLIKE